MKIFVLIFPLFAACASIPADERLSESVGVTNLHHDHWLASLPGEWKVDEDGGVVIASTQRQQYALYISVYSLEGFFDRDDWASNEIVILQENKYALEGYDFKFLIAESSVNDNESIYIVDGVDENKAMRLYSKGILRKNILITISYHDYGYTDPEESNWVLKTILDNLEITIPPSHTSLLI